MNYVPVKEKYPQVLLQFVDKENPPENILLFKIGNKNQELTTIMDMFPDSNFYFIDEPYFLNILTDARYRGGKYFNRIKGFEKVETKIPTPLDETEKLLRVLNSILKKIEVEELTVIMNPPYGYQNGIVKPIIQTLLECNKVSQSICLAPASAFKNYISYVNNFSICKNLFQNVIIENLAIFKFSKKTSNNCTYEELLLDPNNLQLSNSIKIFNEKHSCTKLMIKGNSLHERWNKSLQEILKGTDLEKFKNIRHKTLNQLDKEKCIFYTTVRTPWDGVHTTPDCMDYELNVLNKGFLEMFPEPYKGCKINIHVFQNKQSRDNFCEWWYSCKEKLGTNEKKKIGLTNKILQILNKTGNIGMKGYNTYFPNLDWSRPWTDEEIIQELKGKAGLPQDWSL